MVSYQSRVGQDLVFFFFKQKTAYEMRISDWSSDVCSSDLQCSGSLAGSMPKVRETRRQASSLSAGLRSSVRTLYFSGDGDVADVGHEIGRASCRERVCQYV